MSADNWTDCPRCAKNHEVAYGKRVAALEKAYGVVPVDEYMAMSGVVDRNVATGPPKNTLREDYEVGVRDGKFICSYRCSCSMCDLAFNDHAPDDG